MPRERASWAFALVVALLVALVGGAVYSFVELFNATTWVRHTGQIRVKVAQLRSTLLDAQTGLDGYIITGRPTFLEPYHFARANWLRQLDEIRAETSDNPTQQERLHRLEALLRKELTTLASARQAREEGGGEEALARLLLDEKRTMDAARVLLADMEAEEARLDDLRALEMRRRWVWTGALLGAGALTFFAAVAFVARQRQEEAASSRRADEEGRLLQAVFAGIDDGITIQDRGGKLIFANATAARMIGFPSAEALLQNAAPEVMDSFEMRDEDGNPFPPAKLPARGVLAGQAPTGPVLLRYRRGETAPWKWSTVEAFPISDAAGNVQQAISVFRDVTDARMAEERRRFLLSAVDELSASLDYETTLAAVARLAVPLLADWCAVDIVEGGRPKRVAIAHVDPAKSALVEELQRRYPPDPSSPNGVYAIVRTGRPQLVSEITDDLLRAGAMDDEHLRLVQALGLRSYMGVPLSVGNKVVGAMIFAMAESRRTYDQGDLSFATALADRAALAIENARLFRELERARAAASAQLVVEERRRQEAEEHTRFADTFVGMLGHDLRNPLNAIIITARLLQRSAEAPGEKKAIDRILSSAQRMSNMVAQLLDLTRSRMAGGIAVERVPVDLAGVVGEVVDELRRAYPGREIALCGEGEVPAVVDRDRLAQVASNLLGNALEHGDPARPVRVEVFARGDAVVMAIHNEGPPIPGDVLSVLFEPFRRPATRGARSKGLGLGLFITEQIVLAHGGRVEVTSTAQEGTTFIVTLPRTRDQPEAQNPGGEKVARPAGQLIS